MRGRWYGNQKGLLHGGDYNPEQWPPALWNEDDRLMRAAHWNSVTVGVFSWVSLEPEEGRYSFDWLDEIFEIQGNSSRAVGLATPSAAPPAWLSKKYPETLRTGSDFVRRKHGNRVNYCWTSPIYREKARAIARKLAERYGSHPSLAYWHVSNELGGECYCELCQAAFRKWLQTRYGTLDALNEAYWSRFWGHTYTDWDQIEAPGGPHGETSIIAQSLDWRRFTTHQIIDFYQNEYRVLKEISPDVPITTNLMGTYPGLDSWKIAPYLDFASWDSYPWFRGAPSESWTWAYTSLCHDLCRSLKSQPFLLMESSPSSSNWYPVMALKRPNAHVLEGLQAVAHGSEGVQYFQWRQGRGSSEQFHGAVLAHNGREDARVFQDVVALGRNLESLSDVRGSSTTAEVALVFEWENSWAIELVQAPRTKNRDYIRTLIDHYQPFWSSGIAVDIANPESDLSNYKLVVAPMLFLMTDAAQSNLANFVRGGGTLVLTYWSAVVNESALAYTGGFPQPLRDALGIWVEEIDALYESQENEVLTHYSGLFENGARYKARNLCERIHPETAEVLAEYCADFYAGEPALTRNRYGDGQAIYVASRNEYAFTSDMLKALAVELGIQPAMEGSWSEGLTVQKRKGQDRDFLFLLNCSPKDGFVDLPDGLADAETGAPCSNRIALPPFGARVLACVHSEIASQVVG